MKGTKILIVDGVFLMVPKDLEKKLRELEIEEESTPSRP